MTVWGLRLGFKVKKVKRLRLRELRERHVFIMVRVLESVWGMDEKSPQR